MVHPATFARVRYMLEKLDERGIQFVATCGYRSPARQSELYAIGRSVPGKRVTNARAFESAHQFGLAVDVARKKVDGKLSWDPADYIFLAGAAREHGLEWGGNWSFPDLPHVQHLDFVTAKQLAPLAEQWSRSMTEGKTERERLIDCWAIVDGET